MTYRAPKAEIAFTLNHVADFAPAMQAGAFGDLSPDLVEAILEEAGRFAAEELAPLNSSGDRQGARRHADGSVTVPDGFADAYHRWCEGGWNGLTGPESHGGQGLPIALGSAVNEIWSSANMAFHLCPLLTQGGIEAMQAHASEALKERYLEKMVSGEWPATMNLTEPQAGSDLNALRARAEPQGDGTYRVFGQKIFITYGEHDMSDNIIHMVLARLPDAPAGTRGISLFLVPKILPDGRRNDVVCAGIEHKLGIHASPTCTLVYGDGGGAIGWLVGEENRGLACMFTMMNAARLAVGVEGVGIAERATQAAESYARERRQGRVAGHAGEGMSAIAAHPDIQRTLMTMRALTEAARGICLNCAVSLDQGHGGADEASAAALMRANLLTPVAKAFATDIGVEVASLGIQVHGGMGFIEETGAAQYLRDARITPIYEGTNGIQAIDLVMRKLPLGDGGVVESEIAAMKAVAEKARGTDLAGCGDRILAALADWQAGTESLQRAHAEGRHDDLLSAATPYLRLFGTAAGGALLLKGALAAVDLGDNYMARRRAALARFFGLHIAPQTAGLLEAVRAGGASITDLDDSLFKE